MFLFDKKLSNLNAKLRIEMRKEINLFHQDLGASVAYVTHGQIEPLTLATKIVVIKGGAIHQIGTPHEIHTRPANTFVANFMGNPAMTQIPVTTRPKSVDNVIEIARAGGLGPLHLDEPRLNGVNGGMLLGLRPEDILEASARSFGHVLPGAALIRMVEPWGR